MAVGFSSAFAVTVHDEPNRLQELLPPIFAIFGNQIFVTMVAPIVFLLWNLGYYIRTRRWFDGVDGGLGLRLVALITSIRVTRAVARSWPHIDLSEEVQDWPDDAGAIPGAPDPAWAPETEEADMKPEPAPSDDAADESVPVSWRLSGLSMMPEDEEFVRMEARKQAMLAHDPQKKAVWVRPQPPGVLFMLVGYILWLLGIDLLVSFVLLLVE